MRRASWIMGMALGGLGLAGVPAAAQVPPGSEQVVSQAETFLRKLEANDGAGAMALVGPQMKAAGVTAEMLTVSWKQLSGGSPLTGLRASAVNEIQGYKAVDFAGIARSAGIKKAYTIADIADFEARVPALLEEEGPVFVDLLIEQGPLSARDYKDMYSAARRTAFRAALQAGA